MAKNVFDRLIGLFCSAPAAGDYVVRVAADGSASLVSATGAGPKSTIVDNGDGTFTHGDGDGGSTDVSACGLIGACSIGSLGDVDMTTAPPFAGEYMRFDGSNWVPVPKLFEYIAFEVGNSSLGSNQIVIDVSSPTLLSSDPGGLTWTGVHVYGVSLQRNAGGAKMALADYEYTGASVTVHLSGSETVAGGHTAKLLLIQ